MMSNSLDIVTGRPGELSGEVYIKDAIPKEKIVLVLINQKQANRKIRELDICAYQYGSASFTDKV